MPIRSGRGHRIESVGNRHDLRGERYIIAGETVGVPRSVIPLVVISNDMYMIPEKVDWRNDLGSLQRVQIDEIALGFGK